MHKNYSRSFIKLPLNHWCHMNYFNDVLTTFLGLEHVSCVAVYAGSESSWISSKISEIIRNIRPRFSHVFARFSHDLKLCQSRLHTASETFVCHKIIQIRFNFLRFRIHSMYFDRKGWGIRKILDSVCNGLYGYETTWGCVINDRIFIFG